VRPLRPTRLCLAGKTPKVSSAALPVVVVVVLGA